MATRGDLNDGGRIWMRALTLVALLALLSGGLAVATVERKGAAEMVLEGGSSGPVPFPHLKHQQALTDCNLCHDLFAQEKGVIERLKAEGGLNKKQIMNKKCIGCHKERKLSDKPGGPLTCTECHKKG